MPGLKLLDNRGYMLLQSLLDLALLLTLLPLIVLFFLFALSFSQDLDSQHLEWQLFTIDFQTYLYEVDSIELINDGGGIRVMHQGTEYDIESYGTFIRKQKFRLGHEIMLTEIDHCFFEIKERRLFITAHLSSGITKRAEYVITPP
ncbi:ComGF family competence protein [Planococcus salinus]|uniref:Competence protein ComGF n=1 Tax=Planococcus salinus TaxID=1848460 RepID=A0A3M8PBR8_9BACL|nr:ComGF family competence protein [Planococcus salinus]RNF41062.1 hypothetical protein EEX84_01545 [Planococcus salinus]